MLPLRRAGLLCQRQLATAPHTHAATAAAAAVAELRSSSSLWHARRWCCSAPTPALFSPNSMGVRGPRGADGGEEEEFGGITIFRPDDGLTPEEKQRKHKTDTFLRVILTTGDEQEWKDMLSAALRCGTWREHHLQAVLRGVRLLKYNTAPPAEREASANKDGRDDAPSSLSGGLRSNPTQRLERAKDIVVFLTDEAEAVQQTGTGDEQVTVPLYRPKASSVHNMLTQLLRGAEHHHSPSSPSEGVPNTAGSAAADALPHALYKDVWSFLAWMELHNYHVQSMELLTELEATIDLDEDAQEGGRAHALSRLTRGGSSPTSSPAMAGKPQQQQQQQQRQRQPQPLRYALMSRRVNRLEYIRREKEWLLRHKGEAGQSSPATDVGGRADGGHRRRPSMPRADPAA